MTGALTNSASITRPAQAGPLWLWGLSLVLQAAMGVEPDLQNGAWVVPGGLQADLSEHHATQILSPQLAPKSPPLPKASSL